jgi:cell division protein FtsB
LVVLIFIIIWSFTALWKVYQKKRLTEINLDKTVGIYDGLRAREKMLSAEIEKLKTVEGQEEEIREKYGLVKPSEEVIVVVDKDDITNTNSNHSDVSFWHKIKDWFK